MHFFATCLIFASITFHGIGVVSDRHAEDSDFVDLDAILQDSSSWLSRIKRDPFPGYGGGGGLAAVSGPLQPGQKPPTGDAAAASAPAPAPAPAPPVQPPKAKPAPPPQAKPAPAPAPAPAPPPPPPAQPNKIGEEPPPKAAPAPAPAPKPAPGPAPKQQKTGSGGQSGEKIANEIYNHPNECGDPKNNGVWAPLPKGQTCGGAGACDYPRQWCSARTEKPGDSATTLSCQDLPPECQKVLGKSRGHGSNKSNKSAPKTKATSAATKATTTVATTSATTEAPAPTTASTPAPAPQPPSQTGTGPAAGNSNSKLVRLVLGGQNQGTVVLVPASALQNGQLAGLIGGGGGGGGFPGGGGAERVFLVPANAAQG